MADKPGRLAARLLKSLCVAKGGYIGASRFAASQNWVESRALSDMLQKAGVGSHTPDTMASILATPGTDFAAVRRPLTVIGRLTGFRRVPPLISCVTQSAASTAFWTDYGAPAPLSALSISAVTLAPIRLTAMAAATDELVLSSDPAAEETLLRDLVAASVQKEDETFLDPTNAGSPETLPKSVTHDAQQFVSSGTGIAAITADLQLLANALSDGGSDLQSAAWVLNPRTAIYLAGLRGTTGGPVFPGLGIRGGELLGLPALVSGSVLRTGSPELTYLALIDPSRIWLTEGPTELSASKYATLEMDDGPVQNAVTGSGTALVSMFQTSTTATKSVSRINWQAMTAASAATVLTGLAF